MKVKQRIIKKINTEIFFSEITLLSEEEYDRNRDIIPSVNGMWWLRSCGALNGFGADAVDGFGEVDNEIPGIRLGVRPVLLISIYEPSNPKPGDKFELAGHTWTVIRGRMMLCDSIVSDEVMFTTDGKTEYEQSNIKKWLKNWAARNKITFEQEAATT